MAVFNNSPPQGEVKVRGFTEKDLPGWTKASRDLYGQYTVELVGQKGWTEIRSTVGVTRGGAPFIFNNPEVGAVLEYVVFFSGEEQKSITIMQFGPRTEGPPGFVHGGAIGTAGEICVACLLQKGLNIPCLAANININYRR
ncbi:acyl-coenzyme A thioesterase THEM4-like [Diadema antillarum]|uniref:acyl-coenzyme A thioesterase THEM4-like n=1 Tax=Diadema antillarum TaxID=105358 RepID=UPI003A8B16D8